MQQSLSMEDVQMLNATAMRAIYEETNKQIMP